MRRNMFLMITAALSALSLVALPAVASAGTPQIHCPNGAPSCNINFAATHTELQMTNTFAPITCTSISGSGRLDTTSGSLQLLFHGCKDTIFGIECGTTTTTSLPFDLRYLTVGKTVPGFLLTPNPTGSGTHFMNLGCAGIITGNGVMGRLSAGCTSPQTSLGLVFEIGSNGHQTHKQITGTGAIYDLTAESIAGPTTFAINTIATVTLAAGGNFTVTCV